MKYLYYDNNHYIYAILKQPELIGNYISMEDEELPEHKLTDMLYLNEDNTIRIEQYEFPVNPEAEKNQLRRQRKPLLEAFDKYKTNVLYGVITESKSQHTTVMYWYYSLLDLQASAFSNIPDVIKYYVED